MWKIKLPSKSINYHKKKSKAKNCQSPTKNIGTCKLSSLFQLQQKRWNDKFDPPQDNLLIDSDIKNQLLIECSFDEINKNTNIHNDDTGFSDDIKIEQCFIQGQLINDFKDDLPTKILTDEFDLNISNVSSCSNSCSEIFINDKVYNSTMKFVDLECITQSNSRLTKDLRNEVKDNIVTKDNNAQKIEKHEGPYYFYNFMKLLNSVLDDNFYDYLFIEDDRKKIYLFFNKLTYYDQCLYIRLFLRKHTWLNRDNIHYNEFDSIDLLLQNLVKYQFLDDVNQLENLNEALHCLKLSDIKLLCKNLHEINASTKPHYISAILLHSKSVSKFISSTSNFEASILKKAKFLIRQCYRLNKSYKNLFMRIFTLASLQHSISDDDFSGHQLIFQMSLLTVEQIRYPNYIVTKNSNIFENRGSLIQYCIALDLESRMWIFLNKKQFHEVSAIVEEVSAKYLETCFNDDQIKYITTLPEFLRPFSLGGVYTRILSCGVKALESLKNYDLAIKLLNDLLDQNLYHLNYRGRWFDRLSLNIDFHLKQPAKAILYIEKALNDPHVKAGHRYNLLMRAKKICYSNSSKRSLVQFFCDKFKNDYMNEILSAPLIYVNGLQIPHQVKGMSQTWLSMEDDSSSITLRVEQLVLQHYSKLGYYEGLHAEGLTFLTLYMLLMWDIVFQSIPDVFINKLQDMPLDFRTNSFYFQRKKEIDNRLDYISSCSCDDLCDELALVWERHFDIKCSALDWHLFRDLKHLQSLVVCMDAMILASIFKRMSIDNRHVFGGVPDLIVWNPVLKIFKVIEVKGPNDKLSAKQILWLDYLLRLNVDAEVCHVKAIKRKRID